MDYMKDIREISDEQAVILWQASRLSLSGKYEKAPEILSVKGSVIGTLGNFSASIGKAKSKKTFNVSAIVAAALKNGTVLRYAAELPEAKRKVLYVDTEQSPHHCLNVMERIMRMAGLPDDRDNENLEFLALRKYTPEQRIRIVGRVNQRVQHYEIFLKKTSLGVKKLSFSLGLALIFFLILAIFPSVTVLMSVPFGIYWRTSLLAFSMAPFCHAQ